MSAPKITAEELRSLVVYDPATGVFTWLPRAGHASWNTKYAGKPAGFDWRVGRLTYRSIRIYDWPFLAHRLAWLYMTGEWPAHGIDHRDLDGLNNRWNNLRLATKTENGANTRATKRNRLGLKGVCAAAGSGGRFRASIGAGGKQKHLGTFDNPEDAHAAYAAAARELFGEFARTS